MPKVSEQISKANATSQGRTDANLANDSNNLGGIPAEDYATKQWVREYHDGKESDLGQYVDEQDQKMLDEAKEYANSLVRNQDFSGFAEIKDLQALNDNLTEQITEGLTEQKNYTDSKTQQIVTDVNANFQDVENSISTLNGTVNDLFQSVSNGKAQIAGAITDKGVPTSATDSYSTMATNIRSIETAGDVEIDPNFVNTSDGTATADDIRLGKAAYVKGQKVYGALVPLDTSDATATSSDILSGKTAYVDGKKIFGSLVVEEGGSGTGGGSGEDNPNKGIDTSDATATSADIAYGKTAYARGQKLTGTLVNTQVEEIYGIDAEGATVSNLNEPLTKDPVTQEELGDGTIYFSKNLDYAVVNYPDKRYIYSHPIGENGIYIMATTSMGGESTYKKYKYTYDELGISNDETIYDIAFGASGVNGNDNVCYLFITTRKQVGVDSENDNWRYYDWYLYIKTYHLRENGVIGKEYDGEEILDYKYTLESNIRESIYNTPDVRIIPCNLDIKKFFYITNATVTSSTILVTTGEITVTWQGNGQPYQGNVTINTSLQKGVSYEYRSIGGLNITLDDRYILNTGVIDKSIYVSINPDNDYSFSTDTTEDIYSYDSEKKLLIRNRSGSCITVKSSMNDTGKDIYFDLPDNPDTSYSPSIIKTYSIGDTIVCIYRSDDGTVSIKLAIFKGNISILADGTHLTPEITYNIFGNLETEYLNFYSDINTSKIFVFYMSVFNTYYYKQVTFGVDTSNIVAVRYRDKLFYSVKEGILTATTEDVRTGKTFIGVSGDVQTGTMEV